MLKRYELKATTQKSYYRKAFVTETETGATLTSYTTDVCKIENGQFIRLWDGWSVTTANHVNDFRLFFGLGKICKKDWLALTVNS